MPDDLPDDVSPTGTRLSSPGWVLVGSTGLWAADCLRPGCLWTVTTSTPEAADSAAQRHDFTDHPEFMEDEAA